jgi:nitrite reductase/ring-hydroxylating ferredoxin subunit
VTTLNSNRVRVASSSQIEDGGRLVLGVDDLEVGIFRVDGELCAFENRCPHAGGPVCQGTMLDGVKEILDDTGRSLGQTWDESDPRIVCPWHGYEFSLKTGAFPTLPHIQLRRIPVEEDGGDVYVRI